MKCKKDVGIGLCQNVDLCFHASSLPCLDTFWQAIPTSFNIYLFVCKGFGYVIIKCSTWLYKNVVAKLTLRIRSQAGRGRRKESLVQTVRACAMFPW